MNEPKLKRKNIIKKIFSKRLILPICTMFILLFVLVGSSYAILSYKTETGLTDVLIKSGNLVATITSTSNTIEMNYTSLGVSDTVGLGYNPYTFTISNTGNNDIAYYEVRIVDKEYSNSTLPHKSLNYAISKNNGSYTSPLNLGDCHSYIYTVGSLAVGSSDTFNLKLWVNEEYGKYANNKKLVASIELTLYSDNPIDNYIIYDTQGGSLVQKTNVNSYRVSNQLPVREYCIFLGWSTSINGEVEYQSNAIYNNTKGMILYAVWKELPIITYNLNGGSGNIPENLASAGVTNVIPTYGEKEFLGWSISESSKTVTYNPGDSCNADKSITLYAVWLGKNFMNTFPTSITDEKANITQVNFLDITDSEIKALNVKKINLTYKSQGKVTAWFEVDENDISKKVLNIGSDGVTFLESGLELFQDFSALRTINFNNVNTSHVTDMSFMFYNCSSLTELNLSNFDTSNVTNMVWMFYKCSSLTELNLSNFDTSNVENMGLMFNYCSSLIELDLSNWNVSSVTNVYRMFEECSNLTTIYANTNWKKVAINCTSNLSMFYGAYKLVGAVSYDYGNDDISMANPDTGYFTRKA